MHRGLDPRVVDELPWRDIDAYLTVHDLLEARSTLGGIPD